MTGYPWSCIIRHVMHGVSAVRTVPGDNRHTGGTHEEVHKMSMIEAGDRVKVTRMLSDGRRAGWVGDVVSYRPSEASYGGHNLHMIDETDGGHVHLHIGRFETIEGVVS